MLLIKLLWEKNPNQIAKYWYYTLKQQQLESAKKIQFGESLVLWWKYMNYSFIQFNSWQLNTLVFLLQKVRPLREC